MDELVDVVDENLNVISQELKSEAHRLGLLHPTVIIAVKDSHGRIILVKQSATRQEPGLYVCPVGGHVKSGESFEEALLREASEEIGTKKFIYKFVGKAIFNREILGRKENHFFILYEIILDSLPNLGEEADSYEVFTEEDLKDKLKNSPELFGTSYYFLVSKFYPHLLS